MGDSLRHERRLIAPPSSASRTASTRWCLSFETYLLGPEALLAVLEIDGDDSFDNDR